MKPIPKWLMIPPAVGLLLVLGPLSMQGAAAANREPTPPTAQKAIEAPANEAAGSLPTLPRTPDFWQIGSALLGVLLLGGLGVYGLRRLRGGAIPTRGTKIMTLRQTLRLSQRQALHAIEFDDRILLVGETDRGLALIERGAAPESASDEADVAARAAALLDSALVEEDGAVPKNLVIPRPESTVRPIPSRPTMPKSSPRSPNLNDFRALLQKAGRA